MSPDGTARGQTTWYDYAGKPSGSENTREGTNSYPQTIARVLPNLGTTQTNFTYLPLNFCRHATNLVTSYGSGATYRTNQLFYYSTGRDLQKELGPNGELLRGFSFDSHHQVLTFTNAAGDVTTYTYTSYKPTQRALASGLTTYYGFDANGFILQVNDSVLRTNLFTYQSSAVRTNKDPRNMSRTFSWDGLQRLTRIDYPDSTYETNGYTALDLTIHRDRLGFYTYFGYDGLRRKISETDALGTVTRYGYCECGAVSSTTNAYGVTGIEAVTTLKYDLQGNATNVIFAGGTSLTNRFDALRRLTNRLDALSSTVYRYNNQGLLTSVSNALGQVSATVFNTNDRPVSVTDASGVTVTQTFDNLCRLLTRTYPDSGLERWNWTARGLSNYVDQLGKTNWYVWDAARRLTAETNANPETLQFTYNFAGDLLTLIDGKNQTNTWKYDEYGRAPTSSTKPMWKFCATNTTRTIG